LPNHRFFVEALEREVARARRYMRTCSLFILGVDRRLPLPDIKWRDLAAVLKKALRQSDLLCRHRDGRFVAILPETGIDGARQLVDRLLGKIRRANLQEPAGSNLIDRIRCGLATYPDTVDDPKDLLARAEDTLSLAWQEGAEGAPNGA
jgi:diguanylate cyclase (GGDEF)-like protein